MSTNPSPSTATGQRISRRAAARYLGVAEKTLNQWATRGWPCIPYYRVGRKAVYDTLDLDAYLAKHRVCPGGER